MTDFPIMVDIFDDVGCDIHDRRPDESGGGTGGIEGAVRPEGGSGAKKPI
jgi:hypothetical protein